MVAPAGASSISRLQVVTSSHCWLTSPRAASLHSTSYTAEERWDSCNHTDDHQHRCMFLLRLYQCFLTFCLLPPLRPPRCSAALSAVSPSAWRDQYSIL